jgi:hypothetical protein
MAWLVAGAILVVFLAFAAGFRKSAAGIAVAALLAGFALYHYNQRQLQQATTRIATAEITLENISFRHTYRSSADVTGTIRNNSETYTLHGVSLDVTVRDCRGEDTSSACVVLGNATTHAAVIVPPREARNFTATLYFGGDLKPKGALTWEYEIGAITAKR